jgi:hypothetical protein
MSRHFLIVGVKLKVRFVAYVKGDHCTKYLSHVLFVFVDPTAIIMCRVC